MPVHKKPSVAEIEREIRRKLAAKCDRLAPAIRARARARSFPRYALVLTACGSACGSARACSAVHRVDACMPPQVRIQQGRADDAEESVPVFRQARVVDHAYVRHGCTVSTSLAYCRR